ncbi:Dyp-type peroxidase [Streptomyces sp. NPDC051211]|uniref:Dyp-type peroxidase n=1 Tax=Streptomyces sp. NPDC051211 TaxID=3154643 RepID=UPI003450F25B
MTVATLELDDIQGLIPRGYSTLKAAGFLVLAITDPATARPALAQLSRRVENGRSEPSGTAVNLAFTSDGLRQLGLETADLGGFSEEFVSGMTDPNRSRFLGDVGEDAPQKWRWGGPTTPPVHALALLYARDPQALDRLEAEVRQDVLARGLMEVVRLGTTELTDREPFGFRDGISQPLIEGLPKAKAVRARGTVGTVGEEVVKAGEFVLGYPNEYGLLTDRPQCGHNGSYLVFRQLHQDVEAFWNYLDEETRRPDGTADPAAREALAARMVGRWPSGAPLVHAPTQDAPGLASDNAFGYFATDPDGLSCPLGAHIRRANPRDSLDPRPGSAESIAIGRRHRILRRGRTYGPVEPVGPVGASEPGGPGGPGGSGDGSERGLHFLCLNANISRQFEFVQHTWLNNPAFNGLYDAPDPVVAPRQNHRATFTEQARPLRIRHTGLPQFVSVQGGAYFFLPGLRALRSLCTDTRTGEHR